MRTRAAACRALAAAVLGTVSAVACASMPANVSPQPLAVGAARIDITPDEPLRLTGYGNRDVPAPEVRTRLYARALAFGTGRRGSVLVTADLIGVPAAVTERVAARLASAGVARAQVAVSATHTHNGPSLTGVLPFIFNRPASVSESAAIDRYTGTLAEKLERVARAALDDRRPASLAWGQGRASFAANRRVLKDGRWVTFGVAPDGPVDHDLPILVARDTNGTIRAVLSSYACHATTLEAKDNFVHGDWPGEAAVLLEQRHPGAVALLAVGAGADANPLPRGGGVADVQKHAAAIAAEVDRVLAGPLKPIGREPEGRLQVIRLPLAPSPPVATWEEAARKDAPAGYHARSLLAQLRRGATPPTDVPYPIQTWTFGRDLAMVFLAGEVVADYGLRLKRELDGARLWVNAYSNDVSFYVASERMIPEGGYEVDGSMVYYGQPARLANGTEDRVIAAVTRLLPHEFKTQR